MTVNKYFILAIYYVKYPTNFQSISKIEYQIF